VSDKCGEHGEDFRQIFAHWKERKMILGMSIPSFTLLHVIISVVALVSGFIVVGGLYGSQRLPGWTAIFLLTTAFTSITGFFFPNTKITPGQVFGAVTLIVMVPTLLALYRFHLHAFWRWIYAGGTVIILYLNVFVLIAQTFAKVTILQALAPTQSEPPFLITEGIVLVIFVVVGILALAMFHPERSKAN
jgi:hypothetical protein